MYKVLWHHLERMEPLPTLQDRDDFTRYIGEMEARASQSASPKGS